MPQAEHSTSKSKCLLGALLTLFTTTSTYCNNLPRSW